MRIFFIGARPFNTRQQMIGHCQHQTRRGLGPRYLSSIQYYKYYLLLCTEYCRLTDQMKSCAGLWLLSVLLISLASLYPASSRPPYTRYKSQLHSRYRYRDISTQSAQWEQLQRITHGWWHGCCFAGLCWGMLWVVKTLVTVTVQCSSVSVSPAGAGECAHMRPGSELGPAPGFSLFAEQTQATWTLIF